MITTGRRSPFALDDWIVEPEFNQLTRDGASHRVEPKMMNVLLHLAAQAQRVVSKDEILQAVWPGTYVGEDTLTRCISVLRRILEDDSHNPRFIKTVSRAGYCLLVEPRPLEAPPAVEASPPAMGQETQTLEPVPASQTFPIPADPPPAKRYGYGRLAIAVGLAAGLALSVGLTLWTIYFRRLPAMSSIQAFHLTTNEGEQSNPSLSPDGKHVAFVWIKENDTGGHIYIKDLGNGSLSRLTSLPDDESDPVWSRDGKQIAFLSVSSSGLGLYIAALPPASSLRKIYVPVSTPQWEQGALSWSPDGKSFALADAYLGQPSSSIYLIDNETLRARPLTTAPVGWAGDRSPVFSPDGKKIAFVRSSDGQVMDIYWIPAEGGEPHRITQDGKLIYGITWSVDSRSVVFSSNRAGEYALWRVPVGGGAVQRMPVGTEDATQPAVSLRNGELAFVESSAVFGILQISADAGNPHRASESEIVSATAEDSYPSASPDGSQFAFQSSRSGSQQIWISSIDGQSIRQLTRDSDITGNGSPDWSPEGKEIAFCAHRNGHTHIFAIPSTGGNPRQLTFDDANDIVPRWSADGQSIYFSSIRGGRWQIWKVPAPGGVPQLVTGDDGIDPQESPDGKWLYFTRTGEAGIWRMPTAGGQPERILDQPRAWFWGYFAVSRKGIYFLDQRQATPSIGLYDFTSKASTVFARIDHVPPFNYGISLLADRHALLMSDRRHAGSHISMAEGVF
jgi:Tol biopolymer transport system component/DNA-binding winged helix-turn-helix (wHTH) protein